MTGPIEVVKTVLGHFGIGKGAAQEKPPAASVKAGIGKKSNVVKHNEALKEALDMPKGKK
jgi:hypothetical protein